MTELLPFLKSMLSSPGLSGFETPTREIIQETWRPLVDELSVSRLGSLHGLRRGTGNAGPVRPRLLLSAHMDAIGLMVKSIHNGFLRVTEMGGVDPRILPGLQVTVHSTTGDLPAIIIQPPARLLPPGSANDAVSMEYLWVDTGLLPEEVTRTVHIGDLVSFAQPPLDLGEIICGHSLDNRASVAAVTVCLEELQSRIHTWDVWAVASVQEEETLGGALTSPFEIRPDLAVAIDVTFAKGPGASDYNCFPLGKGIPLGWGPNFHPALFNTFKEAAERVEIPYHVDVMPRHSGTDAVGIQMVAEGIPCALLSIPLRYMHTPVEMVSIKDIRRAGRLMAEFITNLKPDYVQKITWDQK